MAETKEKSLVRRVVDGLDEAGIDLLISKRGNVSRYIDVEDEAPEAEHNRYVIRPKYDNLLLSLKSNIDIECDEGSEPHKFDFFEVGEFATTLIPTGQNATYFIHRFTKKVENYKADLSQLQQKHKVTVG